MSERLRELVRAYGGWSDVAQDVHIYGGGLAVACGVGLWSPAGAGVALFGCLLVFLGLRH
jgi:hypothetical protein